MSETRKGQLRSDIWAAWDSVMMRNVTVAHDAQTRMMDERTATLLRGLETVIRQTAPSAGGEAA